MYSRTVGRTAGDSTCRVRTRTSHQIQTQGDDNDIYNDNGNGSDKGNGNDNGNGNDSDNGNDHNNEEHTNNDASHLSVVMRTVSVTTDRAKLGTNISANAHLSSAWRT